MVWKETTTALKEIISIAGLWKKIPEAKDFDGISALYDVGDVYYNYIDKQKLMKKSKKKKSG